MQQKKIYVDTSAFYALIDRSAHHHDTAKSLLPSLLEDRITLLTSSYVVSETIVQLQENIGFAAARLWYSDILGMVEVLWVDRMVHQRALDLWQNLGMIHGNLSDCISFVFMQEHRIETVFCFKRFYATQGFHVLPALSMRA